MPRFPGIPPRKNIIGSGRRLPGGRGILEGTDYELKSWTALYYYAASMGGTNHEQYAPTGWYLQTRYARSGGGAESGQ